MQKVVIIHNRLVIGGPAVAIAETIKKLNQRFEFFLIVGKPLHNEQDATYLFEGIANVSIIHINDMRRTPNIIGDIVSYNALKKIIKKINPVVVHTHGTKPGLLGRMVAYAIKVPIVIHTYHGHIFHSYFNKAISTLVVKMERWLAKKTTHIVVLSKQLKQDIVNEYKIAPITKVHLLPLLLNLTPFNLDKETKRAHFRSQFNIDEETVAIGIVARITAIKNILFFAKAVVALSKESNYSKQVFFIIGDGEEKQKISNYLEQHQIAINNSTTQLAKVFFTGWMQNVDEVMNGLDVVCLTSLNEGTPVCLIEAMASKKPIIATAVGSIPEMIENSDAGVLIPKNDVNAFVAAVNLLTNNEAFRAKMGEKGYNYVTKVYQNEAQWHSLAQLYGG